MKQAKTGTRLSNMPTLARLGCAVALAFSASTAFAINLSQAYQAALAHDPQYRMAVEEFKAGQEYRVQGRSNLLPSIQASYYRGRNKAEITEPQIFTGKLVTSETLYDSKSANVQLRQPLFNMDALARYRQGVAQTNASAAQFTLQRQELVVRVVSAYIEALFADDQLRLVTAERDTLLENQRVNERMFRQGEGTKTDMLETQARLDIAEAQLLEAKDVQATARATLAGLTGLEIKSLSGLPDNFKVPPLDMATLESWKNTALQRNPELEAQRYAIEVARQEISKAKAGHMPRVDLVTSVGKSVSETVTTRNQDSKVGSIGVQLTVPLYSGGAVSSLVRQQTANYERAKAELDVRIDRLLVELGKQYSAVQSSRTKIAALEKAQASGRVLVQATGQSIKGGVRINLDLLAARQQLYATERDLAKARYDYLLASLRLRYSAGTLLERDVQDVAKFFSASR